MSIKKTMIAGLLGLSLAASNAYATPPPVKGNSVDLGVTVTKPVETVVVKPKIKSKRKAKRSTSKVCEDQFNGQGMCLSESFANSLGLTKPIYNICPGEARNSSHCYDTTDVPVLKSLSGLEGILNGQGKFAIGVAGAQCEADYQRIAGKIGIVSQSEKAMKVAELALSKYITDLGLKQGDESVVPTPESLLGKALQAKDPKIDLEKATKLLTAFRDSRSAYVSAVDGLNADVTHVKKNGCNYVKPTEPRSVSIIPYIGGVVDHKGYFGGEIELAVLAPVGKNFGVGGFLNASLLDHLSKNNYQNNLGITTEDISEESVLSRYLGAGAILRYDVNDWFHVSGKLGLAWMNDELTRNITRFGNTNAIVKGGHEVAFEGAAGFGFTIYKGFELDLEARGNTLSGFDALLKAGYKF